MHYTEPYKLQLNLEISSSNMLEILKQLARLSKEKTATSIRLSHFPKPYLIFPASLWKLVSYLSYMRLVFPLTSWGISI